MGLYVWKKGLTMTTTNTDQISVTADGVTYVRGDLINAIPIDGTPFFESRTLKKVSNGSYLQYESYWVEPKKNVLIPIWIYAAIPQAKQEWVEAKCACSVRDFAILCNIANPYFLSKAVSPCLKARNVKIEWQSGAVEYEKPDQNIWWYRNSAGCLRETDNQRFESLLITAFLAGYRVFLMEDPERDQ
jgi:hypothetical protein